MLEQLGEDTASSRLMAAIETVCREGPRTGDIGGDASTSEVGDAISERVGR